MARPAHPPGIAVDAAVRSALAEDLLPLGDLTSALDKIRFLADRVLQHDQENPQIAAHLLGAFSRWRKFPRDRQAMMCSELERVYGFAHLSKDSREVAAKILSKD